jgi:hypothetical protein
MRASEAGQSRADDAEILRKAVDEKRILIPLLQSHPAEVFEDHLVIVSAKRIKWIQTA